MSKYLSFFLTVFCLTLSHAQYFVPQGSASLTSTVGQIETYQLTPNVGGQAGRVTSKYLLDLTQNFSLEFDLNFGTSNNGADGIAFMMNVITDCNPPMPNGDGYGLMSTDDSLIVEFDTYNNGSPTTEATYDHISIFRDGDRGATGLLSSTVPASFGFGDIEDGSWYNARVDWTYISPTLQSLSIYFDNVIRLSIDGNFINDRFNGDPLVQWHIGAGTGAATNEHQVRWVNELHYPATCDAVPVNLVGPASGTNFNWSSNLSNTTHTESFTPNTSTNTTSKTLSYTDFCNQPRTIVFSPQLLPKPVTTTITQN